MNIHEQMQTGCSVLRHGCEPETFKNRRGKYRKLSASLATVECRAATVSSGLAHIDSNGFYCIWQTYYCRDAAVTVLVEIGLYTA